MGHHAGQLRFVPRGQKQTLVDIEIASRKSEGVDLVRIYDLDVKGNLGIRMLDDVLANPVHVISDHGIFNHSSRLLKFPRNLVAQSDLFFHRYEVGQNFKDPS